MTSTELTPAEKAKITREQNRAAKAKARAIREDEERQDKETAKAAMREILADSKATPQQRLDALEILDSLTYSRMIPYSLKERRRGEPLDMTIFRDALEKAQAGANQSNK